MSKDTLFTNESGGAGSGTDYEKDVFADISLPAGNNTGLTDTAATNPLGDSFANDSTARFGAKTLYIKDIVLIEDRSKWVSNKPTYRVIWHEDFPAARGYIFGNTQTDYKGTQAVVTLKTISDGFGVGGIIRRVAFIVNDDTAAAATAQVVVDGANGATIDFSSLASDSNSTVFSRFSAFVHAAANETKNLHDFRLTALQPSTLHLVGVIVYFENAGYNIEVAPGSIYVNKTKVTSSVGSSLALSAYGSSLGGKAVIYQTASSGVAISALAATTMASLAAGTSGTNLATVTTGHGGSFPIGSGVVLTVGSSSYVGSVVNISTDTLTLSPTLGFGFSQSPVYRAWLAGPTYGINASLMQLAYSVDFSKYTGSAGMSAPVLDPYRNYAFWGQNIGVTLVDGNFAVTFLGGGASGFMQVDGRFSAAEIEVISAATFHATISVNGVPAWSMNEGMTGAMRHTVFTDAGPGWGSFRIIPGASMGTTLGITKINFYTRRRNTGVTTGLIAELETNQTSTYRAASNATLMALGLERRTYADQLYLKGSWVRGMTTGAPSGVQYAGSSTNAYLRFEYFGKDFAIIGTPGTSGVLQLDGGNIGVTFGFMLSVATEGFHALTYQHNAGTCIIQAIDYAASAYIKALSNIATGQRSVLLIRPDGVLRKLSIDNSDAILVGDA